MRSVVGSCVVVFFFFKQKTAYEMRISDWSSDVCSSDLEEQFLAVIGPVGDVRLHEAGFQSPLLDLAGVVHRRAGRLCDRNQAGDAATAAALAVAAARRAGDGAGDDAPDGEIGAGSGAGAAAEEAEIGRAEGWERMGQDR